jgi:hypothetical protein
MTHGICEGGPMASMRNVSKVIALVVVLGAPGAWAADLDALKDTTPKERAAMQTTMMKSKLGLTDAQTPKIAAINRKYADRMEPVIKGSQGPLMRMRAAKEIESQKETELKAVLTPDQFQKFLADKQEMREKMSERIMEQRAHSGK